MEQPALALETFNPFDPAFLQDPYRTYAAFRERGSIHGSGPASDNGGVERVYVFGHKAACALLADRRVQRRPIPCPLQPGRVPKFASGYARMISDWMLFQDPPDHTRLKAVLGRAFTPSVVSGMRKHIARIANRRIDAILARGSTDLIADFAGPLPVEVIAELLGVQASDWVRFKRWSGAMSAAIDLRPSLALLEEAETAVRELRDYFARLVAERVQRPRDGLLGSILTQMNQEQGLNEDEAFAMFTLLLSAGHETETNLLGNGMLALLTHPEQLALLREDPRRIRIAIEELLRYNGPVQMTSRIVAELLEIEGHALPAGQHVLILVGSANRDRAAFRNPDQFDVTRNPNPHLTFGLGVHYCIGAPLARLQAEIAIDALIRRLPNLRVDCDKLEWRTNASFRGLVRLPCRV